MVQQVHPALMQFHGNNYAPPASTDLCESLAATAKYIRGVLTQVGSLEPKFKLNCLYVRKIIPSDGKVAASIDQYTSVAVNGEHHRATVRMGSCEIMRTSQKCTSYMQIFPRYIVCNLPPLV